MTARCGRCGYAREYHDGETARCPGLKRGQWMDAVPPEVITWREIMRRDVLARAAEHVAANAPYVSPLVVAPLVRARRPQSLAEIAGYQGRQALGIGRAATSAGWHVAGMYAMAGDGREISALTMHHGDMRAAATWLRAAGLAGTKSGWSADVAYAWRTGEMPRKVTHTDIEAIFK